jgi:poly-beta-1,6-N-acetyl-D-glucosamine synthase
MTTAAQVQSDVPIAGCNALPAYVLITPARNEAAYVESTIHSVVAQTVRPQKWVIVSDGSSDGTDEIVLRYTDVQPWIELVRMDERFERNFAGKVRAFNAGLARVKCAPYEIIGNLDADISFEPDYFEFLLSRFAADSRLGVAGTPFNEAGRTYDYRFVSIEHVSGACQLFRRACFEEIGGYRPMPGGGIDHVAVITARMRGWKSRTFIERQCLHHRAIGSARHSALTRGFATGELDYALGGHPTWELFRSIYQMTKPPYILGGFMILVGYCSSWMRLRQRPVPPDFVRFRRREQMARLKRFLLHGPGRVTRRD